MGAWIEIASSLMHWNKFVVAPLVGAWIEIVGKVTTTVKNVVAPLVGAWIEIMRNPNGYGSIVSRSPCGSVD